MLTHAQCVALLGAVRSPVYRGVLAVMYGCGLRIGEAVKVTVKDIDQDRLAIRVVGKENKERLAPLPRGLYEDLRRLWVTHKHPVWLFANKKSGNVAEKSPQHIRFRGVGRFHAGHLVLPIEIQRHPGRLFFRLADVERSR